MSRRKQARPIRVLESEDGLNDLSVLDLTNGGGSSEAESASGGSLSESDDEDANDTKMHDDRTAESATATAMDAVYESDDEDANDAKMHDDRTAESATATAIDTVYESDDENANNTKMLSSHVTLEALQNTKVAVAQFAATALANNADNPAALQELAVLQSTLYTLHHQQMMQINLIQQLQQQLQVTRSSTRSSSPILPSEEESACSNVPIPLVVTRPSSPSPSILTPPKPSRTPTPIKQEASVVTSPPTSQPLLSTSNHQLLKASSSPPTANNAQPVSLPPCSISSSFASSIITNLDPPPSPSEPNSLEMLKKRTQEVLDNASQGLLANNLADELAFRKSGSNGKGSSLSPYDSKSGGRNEPFFKHRCRYCGKVFGSDSALQIHIRSHTGERPFKCNVCGSRFTTKGNLKVHFQRHTSKFPHIKMNPNPVPEHLDKYHPPLLASVNNHQNLPPGIPPPHPHSNIPLSSPGQQFPVSAAAASFSNSLPHLYRPTHPTHDLPLHAQHRLPHESLLKPLVPFPFFSSGQVHEQDQPENLMCKLPASSSNHSYSPPPSLSENGDHFKKELTEDEETQGLSETSETTGEYQQRVCGNEESAIGEGEGGDSKTSEVDRDDRDEDHIHRGAKTITDQDSESDGLDRCHSPYGECSVDSKYSNEDQPSPSGGRGDSNAATTAHSEESLQEQPENLSNKIRGNTTCNICYKTFACNSALEIHYRSHTKERPFKCTVCDRGFSTKGNMKQHMLTHKIRDMPSHLFEKSPGSVSVPSSLVDETSNTSTESKDAAALPISAASLRCVPIESLTPTLHKAAPSSLSSLPTPITEPVAVPPQKRSPDSDSTLPVPKRQPTGLPKHLCHVCNKNFSSSSALQIHMRTHTGDKPFRCTICLKAFTTKGNLKVHMGTHMWTNGASRRGRRMSLELPSLPISSKDSHPDLFHRRPDLFYPYLPTPFLNGVHQKLSEISSIQSVSGNLTNGFFPFGGYGSLTDLKRPSSPSPPLSSINRHVNSDSHPAPSPWDLHFERKAVDDRGVEPCTPSPPHQSQHQPHGEGLAA